MVGSTSKTIPYELVYSLTNALKDWHNGNTLITTALIDECNFYFQGIDPNFKKLVKIYLSSNIEYDLIQIALPKNYIHKPLYSIPLYHELGHYIDLEKRVTNLSVLLFPLPGRLPIDAEISHRKEFFADLFSASYTGAANMIFINELAPGQPESFSHPSTEERVKVMSAFLDGKDHPIINYFNESLNRLGLPSLQKRYEIPAVEGCFDNIRPYCIRSKGELHGMLEAGWNYLSNLPENSASGLNEIADEFEPARIINDLTEKSIRNMILKEKWADGTA